MFLLGFMNQSQPWTGCRWPGGWLLVFEETIWDGEAGYCRYWSSEILQQVKFETMKRTDLRKLCLKMIFHKIQLLKIKNWSSSPHWDQSADHMWPHLQPGLVLAGPAVRQRSLSFGGFLIFIVLADGRRRCGLRVLRAALLPETWGGQAEPPPPPPLVFVCCGLQHLSRPAESRHRAGVTRPILGLIHDVLSNHIPTLLTAPRSPAKSHIMHL